MAWDSTRPVPWQRLVREWLVYVAVMVAVMLILLRDRPLAGAMIGLAASGPLYLGIGFVLAKFGYQRKSLRELRNEAATGGSDRRSRRATGRPDDDRADGEGGVPGPRPKPAPTSRTGASTGRPGGKRKRR